MLAGERAHNQHSWDRKPRLEDRSADAGRSASVCLQEHPKWD